GAGRNRAPRSRATHLVTMRYIPEGGDPSRGIRSKSGTPMVSAAARHFCWSAKLRIDVVTPPPAPAPPAFVGTSRVMITKVHMIYSNLVRLRCGYDYDTVRVRLPRYDTIRPYKGVCTYPSVPISIGSCR